jgi:hypothetical protein
MYIQKRTLLAILIMCALISVFIITQNLVVAPTIECTQEAMLCPDGSAVGRTRPQCEFAPCSPATEIPAQDNLIVITLPTPNQEVTSPIQIRGEARGTWFFEGSFPIVVVNWDGLIIGEGIATAEGDWMTTEFVPFTASISYTLPNETPYMRGAIIFKKDNPSGLPEHDDSREIPLTLTPTH